MITVHILEPRGSRNYRASELQAHNIYSANTLDGATGGRANAANQVAERKDSEGNIIPDYVQPGFSKDDIKNMGGSLKIHARIGLQIDIRVIAKINGDIAIGIL